MKSLKKIAVILAVLCVSISMLFVFTACNGDNAPDNDNNTENGDNNGNANDSGNENEDTSNETTLTTYTVLVQDQNGTPVVGVGVQLCSDAGCQLPMNTDSTGKVTFELDEDNYKVQLASVPTGYVAPPAETKYAMLNNSAIITINTSASYIVSVKDQYGAAVEGAVVTHMGATDSITTDASGVAVFNCTVKGEYKVFVAAPSGYEASAELHTYSGDEKTVNVVLKKLTKISVIVKDAEGEKFSDVVVVLRDSATGEVVGYAATQNNGVAVFFVAGTSRSSYTADIVYLENYTSTEAEVVDGYATVTVSAVE